MKSSKWTLFAASFCAVLANAAQLCAAGKDDATQSAYSGGWNESGGGSGFGDWKFQESHGPSDSFAGHFLADSSGNPEMSTVATGSKAFGLYANGSESLADKKTTKLTGRKFSGSGNIESFCIFDRNGEKADGFFNDFVVIAKGK